MTAASVVGAAARVARRWGASGWDLAATTAVLVACVAVAVPVACGLAGLGTSAPALAGVSLAVALPVWLRLPPARPRPARPPAVLAGLAAGYLANLFVFPAVRTDAFHLAEVTTWLQGGRPGTVELTVHDWPAGAYPKANELALTWAVGTARSFAPVALWTAGLVLLLAGATWTALRRRSVPPAGAALAAAVLLVLTCALARLDGASTDLPALAWLAVAASLLAHPSPSALAVPALLALGLAAGTKTNFAVPGVALAVAALWPVRARLARPAVAIAAAAAAALAGFFPLRNLVLHGSPLWPFGGGAGTGIHDGLGDPFLLDARATLTELFSSAPRLVVAVALLLAGAAAVTALAPRRPDVRALAAVTALALAAWSLSPLSGRIRLGPDDLAFLWYLLPVVALATATCALGLRERGPGRVLAAGALAGAGLIGGLSADVLRGAIDTSAGGLAVLLAGALGAALLRSPRPAWVALPVAAAALWLAGPRWDDARGFDPALGGVLRFLDAQPGYRGGDDPVVAEWRPDGRLAGVRLSHPVRLLATDATCAEIAAHAAAGWVVAVRAATFPEYLPAAGAERCLRGRRPRYANDAYAVYAP